ncbi:T3SS (YopN, CesT) and YbjN peptide-binding chaperone 1 [Fimbriimonas ginsengisoli]|nr:YbjN domain-containing protein [Fimbriimonas ginsengisoli]
MTKGEIYTTYLLDEGYRPKTDEDGDIVFKYEGMTYILFVAEKDPEYFRLAKFLDAEGCDQTAAMVTCNDVNRQYKAAKATWKNDTIVVSVELFFGEISQFIPVFPRLLDIVDQVSREISDKLGN